MSISRPEQSAAAAGGPPAAAPADVIKAIPVRHWGRWNSAVVISAGEGGYTAG